MPTSRFLLVSGLSEAEKEAGGNLWKFDSSSSLPVSSSRHVSFSLNSRVFRTFLARPVDASNHDPIEDGGAMKSIGGHDAIIGFCGNSCLPYEVLPLRATNPTHHCFGLESSPNLAQVIVCRMRVGLRTRNSRIVFVHVYATEDLTPILLCRDFLGE
jgi:hypothetical protein